MKLTIGIPIYYPYVHWRFWKAYEELLKPKGFMLQIVVGSTIAVARNNIINLALENKSDYLLFLDSDMVPTPDMIQRLLSHKKEVVGALAFSRSYPHDPITMRLWNDKEYYRSIPNGELMDVDATGGACLLIDMKVFKKIEYPWFDFSVYQGEKTAYSEDVIFCRKLKNAGFKIFIDTGLSVGHISDRIITQADYREPTVRTFKEFDELRDKKK